MSLWPGSVVILKMGRKSGSLALLMMGLYQLVQAQEVQIWVDGYAYNKIGKFLDLESNIGWNKLVEKDG